MDLTIATPIRITISDSVLDSDHVTSSPPIKVRKRISRSLINDKAKKKSKSFFKPKDNLLSKSRPEESEIVSGTLWSLEYSIDGKYLTLNDSLTTKELNAFILSPGETARGNAAINFIDSTLLLSNDHVNKYTSYTSLDYNILDLMQGIRKTKIFDNTELGERAKHFIDVLYADQLANNASHIAREALKAKFSQEDEASLEYLLTLGIKP